MSLISALATAGSPAGHGVQVPGNRNYAPMQVGEANTQPEESNSCAEHKCNADVE
jgi:hypothetical protein